MQLFSMDATIFKKNMKKTPSKVAHNQSKNFQHCQLAQKNKNCSPRDLCMMTLCAMLWQVIWNENI